MKIFKKNETVNITLTSKNQKSKTITILNGRDEKSINRLKLIVEKEVIKPLSENTKSSIYINYRLGGNRRVGNAILKTNKSVEDVYNHFMSIGD